MAKFYVDLANNIYNILSTGFNQSGIGIVTDEFGLESAFNEVSKVGTPAIFLIKTSEKSTEITKIASAYDADVLTVIDPQDIGIYDEASHLAFCMYKANCINIFSKLSTISNNLSSKGQVDLSEHLDKLISISKNSNASFDKKANIKKNEITKLAKMQEIKDGIRKI